ncbi:MAG: metallophosphoesterase [Patescibacteria group bacterium]|jgi:UDP-2,3-diacylglucosamine pyrophosphatase LpxH
MNIGKRLTDVFEKSETILLDGNSKFILFSDCHRGINNWFDNFSHNKKIFLRALSDYHGRGFFYIEIGDGDELWENKKFSKIFKTHQDIFLLMEKFHKKRKLRLICGNHDIAKKERKFVTKNLYDYHDYKTGKKKPLFRKIKPCEGIILKDKHTENKIFLVHGHQGDLLSDQFWWVGKFFVMIFWRYMQLINIPHPASPAKNIHKRKRVVKKIKHWAQKNSQPIICGHTHQYIMPDYDKTPYFNTGCCVYSRCITGIEIENGNISLIRWGVNPKDKTKIEKTVLAGPKKINLFFKK